MKKTYAFIAVGFLLLEAVLYFYVDRPLADFTHRLDDTHHDLIDFFRSITDYGKSAWYLWPCGIATLICGFLSRGKEVPARYRRLFAYIGTRALLLFGTIGISGIIVNVIKPIVGRARPVLWLNEAVFGFDPLNSQGFVWNSMPSGHTTTAFALAFSLSMLYPRLKILWFAYALLLAASRVMVDAHYLSDVCAGALLGWLTVRLFVQLGMLRLWKVIFPIDTPLETR